MIGFDVQIGPAAEAADDAELDLVVFEGVERLGGGPELEHDLDVWAAVGEPADHSGEEVGARRAGRSDAQGADLGIDERPHPTFGLIEQGAGPSDVAGEELPGRRELEGGSSGDQGDADLALERGDVLRDRRLAEVESSCCADEGLLRGDAPRRLASELPAT